MGRAGTATMVLAVAAVAALAGGCQRRPRITQPLALAGGKSVPAHVLDDGWQGYMLYCYACHGEKGDGRGPAAPGMRPAPRDFTQGMFKFAGVAAGGLPHDDDLAALIQHGLDGTPMLPWDITAPERMAIVQYLKVFSPRWKDEAPGDKVNPDGADPWVGKEAEAVALGAQLYHLTGAKMDQASGQPVHIYAGCNACHPSYVAGDEIVRMGQAALGQKVELRENPYQPVAKESEFQADGHKQSILATDFLYQRVKNGTTPVSLYRTIAAGIGGTAMPYWKAAVKDADLWALAHYVRSLAEIRGTPAAAAMRAKLEATASR